MELVENKDGTWTLRRMQDLEKLLLERVVEAANYEESPKARKRLFPGPVRGDVPGGDEDGDSINTDWEELVEPELEAGFRESLDVVEGDLEKIKKRRGTKGATYEISVPKAHADDWCKALNQARLVLHEQFDLPDPEETLDDDPGEGKWMAMLQSEIYGVIMEFLVTRILWLK